MPSIVTCPSLLSFVDAKRASECRRLAETATGSRHERILDAARATARAFNRLGGVTFVALLRDVMTA
jgi:hypothetical protein